MASFTQALYKLAETEGLVADESFQPKPVSYIIQVRSGGKGNVIPTFEKVLRGKKEVSKPQSRVVPRESVRTSSVLPQFLWDNAAYVFGVDVGDKARGEGYLAARADAFIALVDEASEETKDEGLKAVSAFLKSTRKSPPSAKELADLCGSDVTSNAVFAFQFGDDLVSDRPAVAAWWRARLTKQAGESKVVQCSVTGEVGPAVETWSKLKKVPGCDQGIGVLVSHNEKAFESWGAEGSDNAPVSRRAATYITTALQRLLDVDYPDPKTNLPMPQRRVKLSNDTCALYWSDTTDAPVDLLNDVLSNDPARVKAVFEAPKSGRKPAIEDQSDIHLLIISGEGPRVKVRGYYEGTLGGFLQNVKDHLDGLHIEGDEKPMTLERIEAAVIREGESLDHSPPNLASEVFVAALTGTPYPRRMVNLAVVRCRASGGVTKAQAGVIKGYLNRNEKGAMTPGLDETNKSVGYLLGRLMAVYEWLQETALGKVNSSVTRRFFRTASSAPCSAFVSMRRLAVAHIEKLDTGQRVNFQKMLDNLAADLADYPAVLLPHEQGQFMLGYHHQRYARFQKKSA